MVKAAPSLAQLRIGRAIRARRAELNISLAALAADLGVAASSLSKLENGLTPITFERLERISRLLEVDMASLLADSTERRSLDKGEADPAGPARQTFGTRRTVTRANEAQVVEGGVYNLLFHATDLLEKKFQPMVADVHCTDIKSYGPYTHHDGEEFNYVLSGTLEFHTDIYAPVILNPGDSIYFDAEMGHAHVRVGDEPCRILGMITPRTGSTVRNGVAAAMAISRADDNAAAAEALKRVGLRI